MVEFKKNHILIAASGWLLLYTVYQNQASNAKQIKERLSDNIHAVRQENPSFNFFWNEDIKNLLDTRVEQGHLYVSGYENGERFYNISKVCVEILISSLSIAEKEIIEILGKIVVNFQKKLIYIHQYRRMIVEVRKLETERIINEFIFGKLIENEIKTSEEIEFLNIKKTIILGMLNTINPLDLQSFLECQSEILRIKIQAEENRLKNFKAENGR